MKLWKVRGRHCAAWLWKSGGTVRSGARSSGSIPERVIELEVLFVVFSLTRSPLLIPCAFKSSVTRRALYKKEKYSSFLYYTAQHILYNSIRGDSRGSDNHIIYNDQDLSIGLSKTCDMKIWSQYLYSYNDRTFHNSFKTRKYK